MPRIHAALLLEDRHAALPCLRPGEVDWHFENLIASGEHPVPVDFETLLHPRVQGRPGVVELATEVERTIEDGARFAMHEPCRRSGSSKKTESSIRAGLPGTGQKTQFVRFTERRQYRRPGTNPFIRRPALSNLPRIRGERVAGRFSAGSISGFTEMYELVLRNRDTLMAHAQR